VNTKCVNVYIHQEEGVTLYPVMYLRVQNNILELGRAIHLIQAVVEHSHHLTMNHRFVSTVYCIHSSVYFEFVSSQFSPPPYSCLHLWCLSTVYTNTPPTVHTHTGS